MTISTGRNSLLENVRRNFIRFVRDVLNGSQRPIGSWSSQGVDRRNRDLEICEFPVRDARRARELIEMVEWCPEITTALKIVCGAMGSSANGDDQGWKISKTLEDESPIDPEVYEITNRCVQNVIGGAALDRADELMLGYGDAFASIGITDRPPYRISRVLFLPTWEMFRVEDDQGNLLRFEQRRSLSDSNPIVFHPAQIVHWRHRRQFLYGRSQWQESIQDWARLKEAISDLAEASRSVGFNPNVHVLPKGWDRETRQTYRQDIEDRKKDGAIFDLYMSEGGDVRKLANNDPDLAALNNNVLKWQTRIIMASQVPAWMFPGIPTTGAREISGAPEREFARNINSLRKEKSLGIKQLLDMELTLHGIPVERQRYVIEYPQLIVQDHVQPVTEGGQEDPVSPPKPKNKRKS